MQILARSLKLDDYIVYSEQFRRDKRPVVKAGYVVGIFHDYYLLSIGRYRDTISKSSIICGDVVIKSINGHKIDREGW